jgi:sugar O-acyltransferase (sialic acid O-acetyltransferase NeuD family)
MADRLIIIGASGHGKVACDIASQMNRWNEILFLDDNTEIDSVLDKKRIGVLSDTEKFIVNTDFFVAIGNNEVRKSQQHHLKNIGAKLSTLIHPNAVIGKEVSIAEGSIIMAGVVINCSVEIGQGCIINTSTSIDHDSIVGDFSHISPGVSVAGNVKIGNNCWLGISSTIINNIIVADDCTIGAGSVVIEDLTSKGIYIGVPAKMMKPQY